MIKRLIICIFLITGGAVSAPVMADTISETAVTQLRAKGYSNITVRRTLLGRIRITATTKDTLREVVIHPLTGQVLRDNLTTKNGTRISKSSEELDLSDGGHEDSGNEGGGENDGEGDGDGSGDGEGSGDGGDGDGGEGGDGDGDGGDGGDGDGGDD